MAKSLVSLMQSYAEQLITLTDTQGKHILEQMVQASISIRYHHLHIHPYAQSILPKALCLSHLEYELDRYCARFSASLSLAKYNNRNICNAHLDVHFDFNNLKRNTKQQTLPCHITMHLDEAATSNQIQSHAIALTTNITLQLNEQDMIQAQQPIQAWYPDLPGFETRSQTFTQLLYPDLPMPEPIDPKQPLRFTCVCCGFPTMITLDDYEYCDVCDWMDDKTGLDIPADLYFARKQFELQGYISNNFPKPEQPIAPQVMAAKRKLVTTYLALLAVNKQHPDFNTLWHRVIHDEQALKYD